MAKSTKKSKDDILDSVDLGIDDSFGSELISSLNKEIKNSAFDAQSNKVTTAVKQFCSTGSVMLDTDISNNITAGGFPVGKMIELYGEEGCGKTLMAIETMKDTQRQGGFCVYIDMERRFPFEHAEALGLNISKKKFAYSTPKSIEEAFTVIKHTANQIIDWKAEGKIHKDTIVTIVYDSLATGLANAELEADIDQKKVSEKARAIQNGVNHIVDLIAPHNILVLFINQVRTKIGVMFGDPTTTPGGWMVKFLASVRIKLTKGAAIKGKNGLVIGYEVRYKLIKNSVSGDGKSGSFEFYFNSGITDKKRAMEILEEEGVLTKGGRSNSTLKLADGSIVEFKFTTENQAEWRDVYQANKEYCDSFVKKERYIDMSNPFLEEKREYDSDMGSVPNSVLDEIDE